MTTLSHLSALRFKGTDAGDFLHNQLSADVMALSSGESTFACYCEPKGRVLALMLVYRLDESYYIILARSLAAMIANRLSIYVMRSKVTIEVLTEHTISSLRTETAPKLSATLIASVPMPHSDKWLVIGPGEHEPDADTRAQDAWKILEMHCGVYWLCPETSGQFLPQMLGFDQLGAINYRKGCYPGQEIVARTHYLGKIKRHPRLLRTGAVICPDPLDIVQVLCGERAFDAVVVDYGHDEDGATCLVTVTRMDPDLTAEKIEYQGQTAFLV